MDPESMRNTTDDEDYWSSFYESMRRKCHDDYYVCKTIQGVHLDPS